MMWWGIIIILCVLWFFLGLAVFCVTLIPLCCCFFVPLLLLPAVLLGQKSVCPHCGTGITVIQSAY